MPVGRPAKRRWRQECPTLIHAQDGGRSGQIPEYGRLTGSRGRWRSCAALDPASAARNAHPTVYRGSRYRHPGCSVARNTNLTGRSPKRSQSCPASGDSPANAFVNDHPFDAVHERTRGITPASERGPTHTRLAVKLNRCFRRYDTASLAAFTGRALMIFRAGFALNIVGSFVNGLMPLRSFVAGFLMTTNLANPGTKKAPVS